MPTSQKKRTVACVSYGEPPKKIHGDVETIEFTIYNFKDLTQKREEYIESPTCKAHGYEWQIHIYPRGCKQSNESDEQVSCYLRYLTNKRSISAQFSMKAGHAQATSSLQTFEESDFEWGWKDFDNRRSVIQNSLTNDGNLIVKCDIQIAEEDKIVCWYPQKLQKQDLLVKLYEDVSSEISDVVFLVEETMYRAHRNILSLKAKKLSEIAEEWDKDSPIPVHLMKKDIFKSMLDFIYTVKVPDIENEDVAKELLVAADRFECIHMKLYVESVIVDKHLKPDNAAAMLIFADSHSCALLKEAAMNIFATDTDTETAKSAEAWLELKESLKLVTELFDSITRSKKYEGAEDRNGVDEMDVTILRKKLEDAGLELDGSRKILVNRLKTYRQTQDANKKSRLN